eukprot:4957265-Alexandrium_andersonii.AAC.1
MCIRDRTSAAWWGDTTSPPPARASKSCPEDARASRYWQAAPAKDPGETCMVTGGAAGRIQLTTPAASKTAS